jgi:hypothetical protein
MKGAPNVIVDSMRAILESWKMSTKKQPRPDQTQSRKFIEAARELGCDEDESAFDEIVKKAAKAPPPRQDEKAKPKKRLVK